jgi:hypothetical protein
MGTHNRKGWVLAASFVSCIGLAAMPASALEPHAEMKLIRIGDVQYMSGGVSKKEMTVLDGRASAFHVRVSFVGKSSADNVQQVSVTLVRRDEGNSVIRLRTAGPVLLMTLPAGPYSLAAMSPGAAPVYSEFDLESGVHQDLRVELDTTPAADPPLTNTAVASSSTNRL